MSDDNKDIQLVKNQQTVHHLQVPQDNSIVGGWTVQGGIEAVTKVSREELKRKIRQRIDENAKHLKAAQAKLTASTQARADRTNALTVPADMYAAMDPIAKAMLAFHPGAAVVRTTGSGEPLLVGSGDVKFATDVFVARAKIAAPGHGDLYRAERQYPLPDDLRALHQTVLADEAAVAKYQSNLVECRNALSNVDQVTEELEAKVYEHQLSQSTDGQKVLAKTRGAVDQLMEELDRKLGSS